VHHPACTAWCPRTRPRRTRDRSLESTQTVRSRSQRPAKERAARVAPGRASNGRASERARRARCPQWSAFTGGLSPRHRQRGWRSAVGSAPGKHPWRMTCSDRAKGSKCTAALTTCTSPRPAAKPSARHDLTFARNLECCARVTTRRTQGRTPRLRRTPHHESRSYRHRPRVRSANCGLQLEQHGSNASR